MKNNKKGALTSFCGGRVTANCIERAKKSDDKSIRLKAAFAESMGIAGGRKKAQAGLHANPEIASQLEGLQEENAVASGPQVTDKLAEFEGMTGATPDATVSPDVAAATANATPTTPNASADAATAKNNKLRGTGDLATAAITAGAGYMANKKQQQSDQTSSLKESNDMLANTAAARNMQLENSAVGPNTGFSSGKGANSYLPGQAGSKYVARYGTSRYQKGTEDKEEKYKTLYEKHKELRKKVGTDTATYDESKDLNKAHKEAIEALNDLHPNKFGFSNLKEGVKLTLPHVGQQVRGTVNKILGTHYQKGGPLIARYGAAKKVKGGKKIDIGFGNYKFQGNEHGESGDGSSSGIVDGSTTTTRAEDGSEVTQDIEVENGEVEVNYTPSSDADEKVKNKKESFILSNYLKADNSNHTISQAYLREILDATTKKDADSTAEKFVAMNEEAQVEDKNLNELASGSNMIQAMLGMRREYQNGTPEGREATKAEIDAAYAVLANDKNESRTLQEIISDTVNAPIRESNKLKETENAAKQAQYDEDLAAYDAEEARVATQKADYEEKGKVTADRRADQAKSSRKNVYGNVDDAGVQSFFEENADFYDFGDVMKDGKYDSAAADSWLADQGKREAFRDEYTSADDAQRVTGNIDASGTQGSELFGEQFSGARLRNLNEKPIEPGEIDPLDPEKEVNVNEVPLCPSGDPCPGGDCSKCPQTSKKPKLRPTGALLSAVPALMQKKVTPQMTAANFTKNIQTGRENRNQERAAVASQAAGTKQAITAGLSGPAAIAAKMNVDANARKSQGEISLAESTANTNRSGQEKGINAQNERNNAAAANRVGEVNAMASNRAKYFNENSDRVKNEQIVNAVQNRRTQKLDFDQDIFDAQSAQVDGEFDRALDTSFANNSNTAGYARGAGRNKPVKSTNPGAKQALKNQSPEDESLTRKEKRQRKIDAELAENPSVARKGMKKSYIRKRGKVTRKRKTKK